MRKVSTLLMLVVLLLSMMVSFSFIQPASAEPVPKPGIVDWYLPGGEAAHESLQCDPEWLKVVVRVEVHSNTTIIVQGKDCYDQDIEAEAFIPEGADPQEIYPLIDNHTKENVTFARITGIFQQNGTHCNEFLVDTNPEPCEEYLGHFHVGMDWMPGLPAYSGLPPSTGDPLKPYYHTLCYPTKDTNPGKDYDYFSYPPEPSNPDPIKIVLNWKDTDKDLHFDSGEERAAANGGTLIIEGINQCGKKLKVPVPIAVGDKIIHLTKERDERLPGGYVYISMTTLIGECDTWSTICKLQFDGPSCDSYYIFTEPQEQRRILDYKIRIDHVTLHPWCGASWTPDGKLPFDLITCYNTFASPLYPLNITVVLRDQDDHIVHSASDKVVVNLHSSGGEIRPSCDLKIKTCQWNQTATLYPDTNPRDVKVVAVVNVPKTNTHVAMNLIGWTEICFDGVSSVYHGTVDHGTYVPDWPIDTLEWGYTDAAGVEHGPFPVPPLPWLPYTDEDFKLNGPIYKVYIALVPGCNLISTPVHPIDWCGEGWPPGVPHVPDHGVSMKKLFNCSKDLIEAIWTFEDQKWEGYSPKNGGDAAFTFDDGKGYWVKAIKPCTIVVSGVFMDQYPFTPPIYKLTAQKWNLVGVTSLTGIQVKDYLESVSGDGFAAPYISAAGPVWVYYARYRAWVRNPATGLWPTEAFWVFNKVPADMYIAP